MKVLIVAKTRQGSGACIGGITLDEGRSVRLIAADAAFNEHAGLAYQVGEVWEVDATPGAGVIPPHVENMIVRSQRRLAVMSAPERFIETHMPPVAGGPDSLYEGLVQAARTGALYIAERTGIPPFSTTFWRPDQPLQRTDESKRIRYRYPTPDGGRTLTFVGFQEPVVTIPAGTLLRVSLAHWWQPEDDHAGELRCYVQLSGWFLPKPPSRSTPGPAPSAERGGPRAAPPHSPAGDRAVSSAEQPRAAEPTSQREPIGGASTCSAPVLPTIPYCTSVSGSAATTDLSRARDLLRSVFGYDDFRPLQAEVIANVLARRDTLAVMPTGSGKSLCFQLPALLTAGLTVVVSPLISLMKDQVDQLHDLGAPAGFLNSTLGYDRYLEVASQVRAGEIKLLYTSPETLLRPETLVLLDRAHLACLTIDEAHCISQWGHDFRPEYRRLLPIRRRYPAAVCAAFTATATERVQRDIQQMLALRAEDIFIASYDRPNLFLAARSRQNGLRQTLAFLAAHREQAGIIYCSTRRQVDVLAAQLAAEGWAALPYHAGLDDLTRQTHQDQFARDRVPIMVATIAFGMGINKSNVRFILHFNLPESLENYYQEIGRAGRDGLRADCLLLFSQADIVTRSQLIEQGAPEERAGRQARLQAMFRYAAETETCRRVPLLAYFGEQAAHTSCGLCDNCLAARGEVTKVDVTIAAQKFLACVQSTGQMFGVAHIVSVLRGSRAADVLRRQHDRTPEYGAGQEYSTAQWRALAEQFIRQGLLAQDMSFGGLSITAAGAAVLRGEKVFIAAETGRGEAAPEITYDETLFARLRALRRDLADAADLPPYVVFSDRALTEMATYFPQSSASLLAIHGVGQRKLAEYGERFLAAIRAHCAERGIQERPKTAAPAAAQEKVLPGSRAEEVGRLFAAGHTLAEIQAIFGVTRGTIVQHLDRCVWSGQRFAPERIREISTLTPEDQARVLAAFAVHGTERLRPVFEALGEAIPYDELHVMRMVALNPDQTALGRASVESDA
jgi:ATP-dependent DNA helicase RecQ